MLLETYSPSHVKAIINALGLDIVSQTSNDFLLLCPFHGNRNSPSFSVSHSKGVYICFNPSCNASGSIIDLVKALSHRNDFEALRFILSSQQEVTENFADDLESLLEEKQIFEEFSQVTLDKLYTELKSSPQAKEYLISRGITEESMDYFKLGYSGQQNMVTVPLHSPDDLPVGIIGRSIVDKRFKNSRNLPRNKTMFNLNRAKRVSSTVVVCESSFDAIRVHQSGFPNVVATLGGFLSKENVANLNRYFTKIIIMTDFDDKNKHVAENCRKCYPGTCQGHNPGRDLGVQIIKSLPYKEVLWACFDDNVVYPHDAKDAGDMTDQEIRTCIINAVPNYEYAAWDMY